MSKIHCEICQAECHSIRKHLKEVHPAVSFEDYKDSFPEAPEYSEKALEAIKQRRAKEAASSLSTAALVTSLDADEKVPLHEAFGIDPDIRSAMNAEGKPIMITRYAVAEESRLRVPEADDGYFFDVPLVKLLLMAMETKIPAYVWGEPGIGKSSVIKEICARTSRPMWRQQHTGQMILEHVVGQWVVEESIDPTSGSKINTMVFKPGPLPLAMKHGWVYLADEFDRGNPVVLSVYQAILEGEPLVIPDAPDEWQVVKPHPRFHFIGTGNTNGAGDDTGLYQATLTQDAATFQRFGLVEQVKHMDPKLEKALLMSKMGSAISSKFASQIIDFATKVRSMFPNEISLTIGPRTLLYIAKIGGLMGDYRRGAELAYINRLPENEREAARSVAQRIFG